MSYLHRFLLIVSCALLVLTGWAATTTSAQTPTPSPGDSGLECAPSGIQFSGEALPDGVTRESAVSSAIAGSDLRAVTSVVCIDPGTEITVEMNPPDLGTTTEISQKRETMIVVLDGVLRMQLVKRCASANSGGPCTGTSGTAFYFPSDSPGSRTEFGTDWVELHPGDVIFLADVTVRYATPTDSYARIMTSGTYFAPEPGSGCHSSCWQFP